MIVLRTLVAGLVLSVLAWSYFGSTEPTLHETFSEWANTYSRTYSGSEASYRFMVFRQNYLMISSHNEQHRQGLSSFSMAVNKFADLTEEEYKAAHLTKIQSDKKTITMSCNGSIPDNPNPPYDWDWSKKATTEVQIEGACGASWAFSATGALEGLYALSRGRILKLSDQQLIECSGDYGNNGCNGGYMDQAFWYVMDNGIALAEVYPYNAKASRCVYKATMKYFKISECIDVPSKNYSKLISAVLHAPVSVAVDSTNFRFYNDGVFDRACDTDLNRGMLLVGYGTLDGKDYWNIKNSQGTDWGRGGYMLLYRDKLDGPGKCGVQLTSFLPNGVII